MGIDEMACECDEFYRLDPRFGEYMTSETVLRKISEQRHLRPKIIGLPNGSIGVQGDHIGTESPPLLLARATR